MDYTKHLDLPIVERKDKPTWTGTFNDATRKLDNWTSSIDTTLGSVDANADAALATANAAKTTADAALPASSYTASDVLEKLKTVDGAASGLDAALLGGTPASAFVLDSELQPAIDASRESVLLDAFNQRATGPRRECVIVGSSNSTPGTWTSEFCANMGLTERNFSVGGGAYSTGSILQQLMNAANSPTFNNRDVGVVVLADASNDIRARVDVGTYANAAIGYAHAQFPNAQIVVLPVIWPSTPAAFASQVPGGYQENWHIWLHRDVDQLRRACLDGWAWLVEDSWTWLTGRDELMKSGEVHPNAAGYSVVAKMMVRFMRGMPTRMDAPWADMSLAGNVEAGSGQRPATIRKGWTVQFNGAMKALQQLAVNSIGVGADVGSVANGYRPSYTVELQGRVHETNAVVPVMVYPNGLMRVQGNVPRDNLLMLTGSWEVG